MLSIPTLMKSPKLFVKFCKLKCEFLSLKWLSFFMTVYLLCISDISKVWTIEYIVKYTKCKKKKCLKNFIH